MTDQKQKHVILDQPCALKYIYAPKRAFNSHDIAYAPDDCHLFYDSMDDWATIRHVTSGALLNWAPREPVPRSDSTGQWDEGELIVMRPWHASTFFENDAGWIISHPSQPLRRAPQAQSQPVLRLSRLEPRLPFRHRSAKRVGKLTDKSAYCTDPSNKVAL